MVSRAAARLLLVNELELFHPARKEERWRRLVSMLCLRPKSNVQQDVTKTEPVAAISNDHRRASMYDTTDAEQAILTLTSNGVKVPKKAKGRENRKMIATDLMEEISRFNAWVTRGKSDPKFGNPMNQIPQPIINQWRDSATRRGQMARRADEQNTLELILSADLPEDAHWEPPLYKGPCPIQLPGHEHLVVDVHRPPTDRGFPGDLVIRVRPETAYEQDTRLEAAERIAMAFEEYHTRAAEDLYEGLKSVATKNALIAVQQGRDRARISAARRQQRREEAAEERLRQERERMRIEQAAKTAAEKQETAQKLLSKIDLKLAEVKAGQYQEFLALPKEVKLMGHSEWAEEEHEEERLKEHARQAALGVNTMRPMTAVSGVGRTPGTPGTPASLRPGTGASLRPDTSATGRSGSNASRPATAEPTPGGFHSRPSTAASGIVRPGTAQSVSRLIQGHLDDANDSSRLDTTVPVPERVGGAEVFTLDGGDNGSIQGDNGGASGDNVEISGAPASASRSAPRDRRCPMSLSCRACSVLQSLVVFLDVV